MDEKKLIGKLADVNFRAGLMKIEGRMLFS